jgi:SpoVK/Ycf46/Vps4 family AAA+-type ATPase
LLDSVELQRLEKEMQAKKKQLEKELVKGEEREKKKLEEEERKYREACEAAFRHSMEEFKKYGPQAIPRTRQPRPPPQSLAVLCADACCFTRRASEGVAGADLAGCYQ